MEFIERFDDENCWLSNFIPCEIMLDGKRYPSVEHAYMSAKSNEKAWKKTCADPNIKAGNIKKLSRKIEIVDDWAAQKVEIMRDCLNQKFSQEPFRTWLLETEDAILQEGNTWGDRFWGVDLATGEGENHLGWMIMEIREKLQKEN